MKHEGWLLSWSTYIKYRADPRLAPSQWETSLQSNAVSHWLGANLESALKWQSASGHIRKFHWQAVSNHDWQFWCWNFITKQCKADLNGLDGINAGMCLLSDMQICGLRMRFCCAVMHVGIPNGRENVPGIPCACATRNVAYLVRGPCRLSLHSCRRWLLSNMSQHRQ